MRDQPENALTQGHVQVLSSLAKDLGFRANGFGGPRQQAVDDCRYSQTMFRPDVVPCFIGFVHVGGARNKKVRPQISAPMFTGATQFSQ